MEQKIKMEISAVPNLLKISEASSPDDREQTQKRHPRRKKEKIEPGIVYAPNGRLSEETGPHIDVTA